MSHVSKIELEINDLETLEAACASLGLQFVRNQKTYTWYGEYMGDTPLPEDFSADDLGKCDHAVRVPGAVYEVGVVRKDGKYFLLWDFWRDGGLERALGPGAGKLKQAYAVERVKREARLKGYRVQQARSVKGIRLVLSL